jgi:hypothetical protein
MKAFYYPIKEHFWTVASGIGRGCLLQNQDLYSKRLTFFV